MIKPLSSELVNTVAAGPFGTWLSQFRASLRGEGGTEVPCGDCVGCCVSSYFIMVRPADEQARVAIPAKLLVSAPGLAVGHKMMGYRPDGTCPMLTAGKCSIYEQRPQTCRDYDCRVFAAAGIDAGDKDKSVINQRVREWRFTYPAEADRMMHDAVQMAAAFIKENSASFPGGRAPTAPTGIAVLATKVYTVFCDPDIKTKSDAEIATAIVNASREFDANVRA
jgi:uncharacterized protein